MAYDRDRYERDRYDRDRYDRDRTDRDRGAFERVGDEVRSWFGDDEARRRRERDERERERAPGGDRPYGERDYSRRARWGGEPARTEGYRDYGDRYGRTYSAAIDRDTDLGRGPAYQPYARGTHQLGQEGYGSPRGLSSTGSHGREWRAGESWRVPGPYTGRGPKGYQRSDERIREELSDRLTAHGMIDATDIEIRIQGGEVTLTGFVDSREAKHAAEDCTEDVPGVREVHNQLRIRSHADDDVGVGRTNVLGLTERETQTVNAEKKVR
ncbi:MAG: BON domain-containing protein [Vicinamibacterales bacterium]